MRVGISLPSRGAGEDSLRSDSFAEAARHIEAAGFKSAWVFDAMGRGFLQPDPLTALAVAASVTKTLEFGTGVLQVPLRNPVELARRVLTTQLVCRNRLLLGVGAGSTAADFAACGLDFASRFRVLDESLAIMKKLWAAERVGDAHLGPLWAGTEGGPPILVGSWAGSRWIERAAREFDGWVASGARSSWRHLKEGIARFRGFGGTRAVVTNVAVQFTDTASSSTPDDPFDLKCPKSVARERLQYIADLGFDDIVLVPRRHDPEHLAELRALA
jgi:alkanesulfonate monooxygenase SsuD/methylene tetrahydromethanopterin reductase-like flavin-dependent oxidoreductase (luciferase family)